MTTPDSIPRKIITYLMATIPEHIKDALYFDTAAQRNEQLPVCLITACPSIPDIRHGGFIDVNVRTLKLITTIGWSAAEEGDNYDRFEEAIGAVVDALSNLQGTETLGSRVLLSEINMEASLTSIDVDTATYWADIESEIEFVR